MKSRAEIFDRIYRANAWNGRETASGPGSSQAATEQLQHELPLVVKAFGLWHVIDAGCGEGMWQPDLPGYVGVDVSGVALERARKEHPDRRYEQADICTDVLPEADAIVCRDALQHLSFADGLAAIQNFRRTGARWLFTSTHVGGRNQDVTTGGWYEIDVMTGPFWLGEPVWWIPDGTWGEVTPWPNKAFGLWSLCGQARGPEA
jgi:SAM-dependent methyltransferase